MGKPTADVMFDVESLGLLPGCVVLQVAMVVIVDGRIVDLLMHTLDMQEQLDAGLQIEPETLKWWVGHGGDALPSVFGLRRPVDVVAVNDALYAIVQSLNPYQVARVWANGAGFDLPILRILFDRFYIKSWPFDYKADRCYRTVLAQHGHLEQVAAMRRSGLKHVAMADAMYQAQTLCEIGKVNPMVWL